MHHLPLFFVPDRALCDCELNGSHPELILQGIDSADVVADDGQMFCVFIHLQTESRVFGRRKGIIFKTSREVDSVSHFLISS